jgi:hypothetical protein
MNKGTLTIVCALVSGAILNMRLPFPDDAMVRLCFYETHSLYLLIKYAWQAMLYTTPGIVFSIAFSWVYVHTASGEKVLSLGLPPFPDPCNEPKLHIVLGERHHQKRLGPCDDPSWMILPDRGLYTGLMIVGATGSGKTRAAMRPFAWQILSWQAHDELRKVAGIALEVKGDFCYEIKAMMQECGRSDDYVELSMSGDYRYNPLHNDQEAFALAYSIASMLNQLYGRGKDPFWQQAYTNMIQFLILLHKVVDGYCTLLQVYHCAINPDRIREKIREGDDLFGNLSESVARVAISPMLLTEDENDWLEDAATWVNVDGQLKAERTDELEARLVAAGIRYKLEEPDDAPADLDDRMDKFQAVKTWFDNDWGRMDSKLRTSIVEGVSVFLSLFDSNQQLKKVFCPPKELYDAEANKDGRYGKPLLSMAELLEQGKMLALNFPIAANPATSRMLACMLKMDFQRAVVTRISLMAAQPDRVWRQLLFICDEYHMLATAGESDPNGDEKFFSLSRQAKCIPIVATQSISSLKGALPGDTWQVLLQNFRTQLYLTQSDGFTAKYVSDSIGREQKLMPSYSISENGQDVRVQMLTGKAAAHKAGVSLNKTYGLQFQNMFEPKFLKDLPTCACVAIAFDGVNPMPPTVLYLKPYDKPRQMSYFEQREKKLI